MSGEATDWDEDPGVDDKDSASFQSLASTDKMEALEKSPPPTKQSSSEGFMASMTKMLATVASKQAKAPVSSNNNQKKNGGVDHHSSGDSAGDILEQKSMVFKSLESGVTNSVEQAANGEGAAPLNPPARSISEERDSFGEKTFKSVDSGVFHSLLSVGNSEFTEALKPPARSSAEGGEGGDEESSQSTSKRKAASTAATEERDSKFSKRELVSLFNSGGSANEILKQELFKSVVADELKSLNSVGNSVDVMAAPLARASSSLSGRFLQSMLGTMAPTQKDPPATSAKSFTDAEGNGNRNSGETDWEAIQRQGFGAATTVGVVLDNAGNTRHGEAAAASGEKKKPKRPPRKRKSRVPLVKNYFEPCDTDVLCGRGGRANNHPGNKKYLELKDEVRPRYTAATKAAKTGIAEEVVDAVIKDWGGRFLALDTKEDKWYEIDRLEARRKCSQALREENTAEARAKKRAKYPKKKKADKERKE